MTSPLLLRATGLACERDERLLFAGLDLALRGGEAWRVGGANGAGKTTLLRTLAGLNDLYEGTVERHSRLCWVGHRAGLKVLLSARENLAWFADLNGLTGVDPDAALAQVGLRGFEDQPCLELSAGQQRRAALARLLLDPAPLWVLDEPFSALDVQGVALLVGLCVDKLAQGGALIFSTHQEPEGLPVHGLVTLQGDNSRCGIVNGSDPA